MIEETNLKEVEVKDLKFKKKIFQSDEVKDFPAVAIKKGKLSKHTIEEAKEKYKEVCGEPSDDLWIFLSLDVVKMYLNSEPALEDSRNLGIEENLEKVRKITQKPHSLTDDTEKLLEKIMGPNLAVFISPEREGLVATFNDLKWERQRRFLRKSDKTAILAEKLNEGRKAIRIKFM